MPALKDSMWERSRNRPESVYCSEQLSPWERGELGTFIHLLQSRVSLKCIAVAWPEFILFWSSRSPPGGEGNYLPTRRIFIAGSLVGRRWVGSDFL